MTSRFRAWLRRRMRSSGKTLPQETTFGNSNPRPAPNIQTEAPPPPYDVLDLLDDDTPEPPRYTDQSVTVEALRAQNPATRPPCGDTQIMRPPLHKRTHVGAASAAASRTAIGVVRALDEPDPRMVAARTAQAIAVAVSTSRSYAAFVAAVTAAESAALLLVECNRDGTPPAERAKSAMAADAGITPIGAWPFNIYDTHCPKSSSRASHNCQKWTSAPPTE